MVDIPPFNGAIHPVIVRDCVNKSPLVLQSHGGNTDYWLLTHTNPEVDCREAQIFKVAFSFYYYNIYMVEKLQIFSKNRKYFI